MDYLPLKTKLYRVSEILRNTINRIGIIHWPQVEGVNHLNEHKQLIQDIGNVCESFPVSYFTSLNNYLDVLLDENSFSEGNENSNDSDAVLIEPARESHIRINVNESEVRAIERDNRQRSNANDNEISAAGTDRRQHSNDFSANDNEISAAGTDRRQHSNDFSANDNEISAAGTDRRQNSNFINQNNDVCLTLQKNNSTVRSEISDKNCGTNERFPSNATSENGTIVLEENSGELNILGEDVHEECANGMENEIERRIYIRSREDECITMEIKVELESGAALVGNLKNVRSKSNATIEGAKEKGRRDESVNVGDTKQNNSNLNKKKNNVHRKNEEVMIKTSNKVDKSRNRTDFDKQEGPRNSDALSITDTATSISDFRHFNSNKQTFGSFNEKVLSGNEKVKQFLNQLSYTSELQIDHSVNANLVDVDCQVIDEAIKENGSATIQNSEEIGNNAVNADLDDVDCQVIDEANKENGSVTIQNSEEIGSNAVNADLDDVDCQVIDETNKENGSATIQNSKEIGNNAVNADLDDVDCQVIDKANKENGSVTIQNSEEIGNNAVNADLGDEDCRVIYEANKENIDPTIQYSEEIDNNAVNADLDDEDCQVIYEANKEKSDSVIHSDEIKCRSADLDDEACLLLKKAKQNNGNSLIQNGEKNKNSAHLNNGNESIKEKTKNGLIENNNNSTNRIPHGNSRRTDERSKLRHIQEDNNNKEESFSEPNYFTKEVITYLADDEILEDRPVHEVSMPKDVINQENNSVKDKCCDETELGSRNNTSSQPNLINDPNSMENYVQTNLKPNSENITHFQSGNILSRYGNFLVDMKEEQIEIIPSLKVEIEMNEDSNSDSDKISENNMHNQNDFPQKKRNEIKRNVNESANREVENVLLQSVSNKNNSINRIPDQIDELYIDNRNEDENCDARMIEKDNNNVQSSSECNHCAKEILIDLTNDDDHNDTIFDDITVRESVQMIDSQNNDRVNQRNEEMTNAIESADGIQIESASEHLNSLPNKSGSCNESQIDSVSNRANEIQTNLNANIEEDSFKFERESISIFDDFQSENNLSQNGNFLKDIKEEFVEEQNFEQIEIIPSLKVEVEMNEDSKSNLDEELNAINLQEQNGELVEIAGKKRKISKEQTTNIKKKRRRRQKGRKSTREMNSRKELNVGINLKKKNRKRRKANSKRRIEPRISRKKCFREPLNTLIDTRQEELVDEQARQRILESDDENDCIIVELPSPPKRRMTEMNENINRDIKSGTDTKIQKKSQSLNSYPREEPTAVSDDDDVISVYTSYQEQVTNPIVKENLQKLVSDRRTIIPTMSRFGGEIDILSSDDDDNDEEEENGDNRFVRLPELDEENCQTLDKKFRHTSKTRTTRCMSLQRRAAKIFLNETSTQDSNIEEMFKDVPPFVLSMDKEDANIVKVCPFFSKILKDHQKRGVKFMWDTCFESRKKIEKEEGKGCILAHDMGLGKSLQVIALLHALKGLQDPSVSKVLILSPKSLVSNWEDEVRKWMKGLSNKLDVYTWKTGDEAVCDLHVWSAKGGIYVLGYEMFLTICKRKEQYNLDNQEVDLSAFFLSPGPDIVVCDEAHLIKNSRTERYKSLERIRTKRRIALTGTPIQNNLEELFNLVQFVQPNFMGRDKFREQFIRPISLSQKEHASRSEKIKAMERISVLHKELEKVMDREQGNTQEVGLPPKLNYDIFVNLSSIQTKLYEYFCEKMKDTFIQPMIFSAVRMAENIAVHPKSLEGSKRVEELRKGVDWNKDLNEGHDWHEDLKGDWWNKVLTPEQKNQFDSWEIGCKLKVAFNIVEYAVEIEDKVLIFSGSLVVLNLMQAYFEQRGFIKNLNYFRLDGSVPMRQRKGYLQKFNDERNKDAKVFLLTHRIGGVGLNFTGANRIIILDMPWNPSHHEQSSNRTHRIGQKKTSYVYRLITKGTLEEKIYKTTVSKQSLSKRVVDKKKIKSLFKENNVFDFKFETNVAAQDPLPSAKDELLNAVINHGDQNTIHSYLEQGDIFEISEEHLNEVQAYENYLAESTFPGESEKKRRRRKRKLEKDPVTDKMISTDHLRTFDHEGLCQRMREIHKETNNVASLPNMNVRTSSPKNTNKTYLNPTNWNVPARNANIVSDRNACQNRPNPVQNTIPGIYTHQNQPNWNKPAQNTIPGAYTQQNQPILNNLTQNAIPEMYTQPNWNTFAQNGVSDRYAHQNESKNGHTRVQNSRTTRETDQFVNKPCENSTDHPYKSLTDFLAKQQSKPVSNHIDFGRTHISEVNNHPGQASSSSSYVAPFKVRPSYNESDHPSHRTGSSGIRYESNHLDRNIGQNSVGQSSSKSISKLNRDFGAFERTENTNVIPQRLLYNDSTNQTVLPKEAIENVSRQMRNSSNANYPNNQNRYDFPARAHSSHVRGIPLDVLTGMNAIEIDQVDLFDQANEMDSPIIFTPVFHLDDETSVEITSDNIDCLLDRLPSTRNLDALLYPILQSMRSARLPLP